ncbi:DAK2 domain-containing protein [Lachnospiraceae bacterium ZAX-1]
MEINTIDASMLAKMFLAGAKNLDAKKEWINELNVFPVPDGDTGTNMSMTILSAAKEVGNLEQTTMNSLAKAISSGSLRGARGNSGVILSQLFRGFTKVISKYEVIDVLVLSDALQKGVETAYKAVMKPKEGTILTVARGTADKAWELADETDDLVVFIEKLIKHADDVLSRTPEMLPVLKQAGVVDSGGQGLVEVFRGAYDALIGKEIDYTIEGAFPTARTSTMKIMAQTQEDIKFGYCTEFIIVVEKLNEAAKQKLEEENKQTFDEIEFKAYLESMGDSIVVVADEEIVKVHVHTNEPGCVITKALSYGSLSSIKVDNMREEHQEKVIKDAMKMAAEQLSRKAKDDDARKDVSADHAGHNLKSIDVPKKKVGFISVSIGDGINQIFKDLNVDYIIEGGQTMNPSTEDMLNAIDRVHAETIFILPNNKNIILAANQAAALTEQANVIVIPTKTIPQGITALINYIPEKSMEDNEICMQEEIKHVKTGQVTYAVRDTLIEDKEIKQGDYMGIGDSAILSVNKDMEAVTKDMVSQLVDEDSSIISIYYSKEIEQETASKLASYLEKTYKNCEVEVHFGGQPIYYYIISVE